MHFWASFPNCQWYQQMPWGCRELSGVLRRRPLHCEWWRTLDCEWLFVCCTCSEVIWRESSSMCCSKPAVLSGATGEMLAVVGWVVTSQILSARWEADSRVPPIWPARIACTCGGRWLAQMVWRKSSGTSGAKPLRCRRNGNGFRSPISSCQKSCLTRCSREVDNRRTSSALSRS